MIRKNPWLDVNVSDTKATAAQLRQTDAWLSGEVIEILDDGQVAVRLTGRDEDYPPVVAPADPGVSAVGAPVRVRRDSTGRVVDVAVPEYIPAGLVGVPIGATGDWLEYLDVSVSQVSEDVDQALEDAQAAIDEATQAVQIAESNRPPVTSSAAPDDPVEGLIWYPLDSEGHVTGMKIWDGSTWVDRTIVAGQLLVPGSIGPIQLADGAITGPKISADAIDGKTITGTTLIGSLVQVGGGELPSAKIGPIGTLEEPGDAYGLFLRTPNSNAYGSASLQVTPLGPEMVFNAPDGAERFYVNSNGEVRIVNLTDGGVVDLARMVTQKWVWQNPATLSVVFNSSTPSAWAFFRAAQNTSTVGWVHQVSSPTGRLRIDAGVQIVTPDAIDGNAQIEVQWGLYTANPNGNGRTDITTNLLANLGRARAMDTNGIRPYFANGYEVVSVTPNTTYWLCPFYRQNVMGSNETRNVNLWVAVEPK